MLSMWVSESGVSRGTRMSFRRSFRCTSAARWMRLAADPAAIVKHYAEIAHAKFTDSLAAAKALDAAVDALIAKPSEETLKAA